MAGKTMTEAQREEWQARRSQQENEMKELVRELAVSWQENPETIAEAVSFGSRMYNYSVRNNMLIYQQNPNAVYVQSFQAWKEMGAAVKSGEKGSKIWVPVEATILKIDGKLVPSGTCHKRTADPVPGRGDREHYGTAVPDRHSV